MMNIIRNAEQHWECQKSPGMLNEHRECQAPGMLPQSPGTENRVPKILPWHRGWRSQSPSCGIPWHQERCSQNPFPGTGIGVPRGTGVGVPKVLSRPRGWCSQRYRDCCSQSPSPPLDPRCPPGFSGHSALSELPPVPRGLRDVSEVLKEAR